MKRVFVIGAGASVGYGLPTGEELKRFFLTEFPQIFDRFNANTDFLRDMKAMSRKLMEAIANPAVNLIDDLINKQGSLSKCARFGIALHILTKELKANFENDWVAQVLKVLMAQARGFEDALNSDLKDTTFITFNYDRMIEYRLYKILSGLFEDVNSEQVHTLAKLPNIIHVYGSLGELDIEEYETVRNERDFGYYHEKLKFREVERAAENIRVMHDERIELDLGDITTALNEAKEIYISGYNFDEMNNTRINLISSCRVGKEKKICVGTVGMHPHSVAKIKSMFSYGRENLWTQQHEQDFHSESLPTHEFIKHYCIKL